MLGLYSFFSIAMIINMFITGGRAGHDERTPRADDVERVAATAFWSRGLAGRAGR